MNHKKTEPVAACLLFLLLFLLRLPHISDSPYEYDAWRQSDTEAMARNFIEQRFNIFYPQLNYDGPLPNYVQLEFQVTTFLIALLYNWFGFHYALARIVPILFFMGSAYFLYLLAKRYFTPYAAWLAVLLYGVFPLNLLYSRAVMPESSALFFYLGAFYFFSRWMSEEKRSLILWSATFTALALSQKLPTVFVGVPMLFMAAMKYRQNILCQANLWLFALLAFLPPSAYFYWSGEVAEFPFVNGIAAKHIFPNWLSAWKSEESLRFFQDELPKAFTLWGIVGFVLGLFHIRWRTAYPIGIWALAMIAEAAAVVAVIKFNYYLIFLSPLAALLAANLFASWSKNWIGLIAASALLLSIIWSGFQTVGDFGNRQNAVLLKQAEVCRSLTGKGDLIVVGTKDPSLLNACERQGWRVGNTIPDRPSDELRYFIGQGAKYFVPLQGWISGDDGRLQNELQAHFKKITVEGGYSVYRLQ